MGKIKVALVEGDGAAPEMMAVACEVAIEAAKIDDIDIEFVPTPAGWCTFDDYGTTFPQESLDIIKKLGIVFFGGVGDKKLDDTLGVKHKGMKPEGKCLLTIRKELGLLLNYRPMIFFKKFAHLAKVRPEYIPKEGITQIWLRYLLEDSYFGNQDLMDKIPKEVREELGIKLHSEVTGKEDIVCNLSYFRRSTLIKYFHHLFTFARDKGLPVICVDKSNVMPHYVLFREVCKEVHRKNFSDIDLRFQYIDAAVELLFTPAKLHGVIACGNEHGDIGSDGGSGAKGGLGLMYSSAINPNNGDAMFESGAGTASDIAGMDIANPIGRINTAVLMLEHICKISGKGTSFGAKAIEKSIDKVLSDGWITLDLVQPGDPKEKILGTKAMGEKILENL